MENGVEVKSAAKEKCSFTTALFLSLAVNFMFFILGSVDAFFANATEFWFSIWQMLIPMALAFVIGTVVLTAVLYFFGKFRIGRIILSLVLCLSVYFYVQGNYVPRNYGVLNGTDIDWSSYKSYGIISIVLIAVFVVISILLDVFAKKNLYKIVKTAAILFFCIQFVSTVLLFVQNQSRLFEARKGDGSILVTTEDINTFSSKQNVIVIILDTFDSGYMDDILSGEHKDRCEEVLQDFTYYSNTVGAYPTTKGALPYILTGEWYENDVPYVDYVERAYEQTDIFDCLNDMDFKTNVYTEPIFYSSEHNDYFSNVGSGEYKVKDGFGFFKTMFKLVSFNYLPHQLKQYAYTAASDFVPYRTMEQEGHLFEEDMQKNFEYLTSEEIKVINDSNIFKVVHTEGVHAPYTYDESLEDCEEAKLTDEILGCFTYLETYFDMLKENGVYDNSTIIVMADHGFRGLAQRPLFMIKNADESHAFNVSDVPMSWEALESIYKYSADGGIVDEEYISSFNFGENGRRFLFYSWNNSWDMDYLPGITEYSFGAYCDDDSAVEADVVFVDWDSYRYEFGTVLSFGEGNTAFDYEMTGFCDCEGTHTWTEGYYSEMLFGLPDDYDGGNLLLYMDYSTFHGDKTVTISVNGNEVCTFTANNHQNLRVVIPAEYITENFISLRLDFPDAEAPCDITDSNDSRILALDMFAIDITMTDEAADNVPRIDSIP